MIEYKCPRCGDTLYFDLLICDRYYCKTCNSKFTFEYLKRYYNKDMKKDTKEKNPCSGVKCCMQRNFKPSECVLFDECQFYTPEKDFSGLDAIIEMAEKEFNITSENQKNKLRILLNAYVAEYLAITCKL